MGPIHGLSGTAIPQDHAGATGRRYGPREFIREFRPSAICRRCLVAQQDQVVELVRRRQRTSPLDHGVGG